MRRLLPAAALAVLALAPAALAAGPPTAPVYDGEGRLVQTPFAPPGREHHLTKEQAIAALPRAHEGRGLARPLPAQGPGAPTPTSTRTTAPGRCTPGGAPPARSRAGGWTTTRSRCSRRGPGRRSPGRWRAATTGLRRQGAEQPVGLACSRSRSSSASPTCAGCARCATSTCSSCSRSGSRSGRSTRATSSRACRSPTRRCCTCSAACSGSASAARAARRRRSGRSGCSRPRRSSSSGSAIGLNTETSNVIDVGYAGVVGAQRISNGDAPYGHMPIEDDLPKCGTATPTAPCASASRRTGAARQRRDGDTYGPSLRGYLPGYWLFGWRGRWDDLPAAHFTSIAWDLIVRARALPGRAPLRRLAARRDAAFAWVAYPFTAYTLTRTRTTRSCRRSWCGGSGSAPRRSGAGRSRRSRAGRRWRR